MPRLSREAYRAIDANDKIPAKYRDPWHWDYNPTLHFCPEWDDLLIDSSDDEFEACLCHKGKDNEK